MASAPPPYETKAGYPVVQSSLTKLLEDHGWPPGLQAVLQTEARDIAYRFCLLDNSGSMTKEDGQILRRLGRQWTFQKCTRWEELTHNFQFHIQLAAILPLPTQFRVLNHLNDPVIVGDTFTNTGTHESLQKVLHTPPSGGTPLCLHIAAIVQDIQQMLPAAKAQSKKFIIVIATDGEDDANKTDPDAIIKALKPLEREPVWVVIRLCTDEPNIVDYWNRVDENLELNIDIIDDFASEALEVHLFNPWITYGLPLHQLREAGITLKEFDTMDEAPLTNQAKWSYITKLIDADTEALPNPAAVSPATFWRAVQPWVNKIPYVWNPINQRMAPWIQIPRTFWERMWGFFKK